MWHSLAMLIPMMAGLLLVGLMAGGTFHAAPATGPDDDDPGAAERRRQLLELADLRRPFDDEPAKPKKRKR